MYGSLQEFMPHYFVNKNNQSSDQQPTINHSLRLSQEPSVSRKNKMLWEQQASNNIDGNVIRFNNQHKKIQEPRSSSQKQSKSKAKIRIQATSTRPLSSEKLKKKVQSKEYIASDKSVLLQSYNRLRNASQIQGRELLELKRLERQMQNATEISQKKTSFMHLKGKLKHNHHLLKSIVRVEQQEMVSQKTAFQISFESLSNRLKEVKLESKLRNMDDIGKDIKTMRIPLFLNKKQLEIKSYQSSLQQSSLQQSKYRMSSSQSKDTRMKLVQDNIKKWAKSKLKSEECQNKKQGLYSAGKSLELRQNQQNRKKIMGNISKLVNHTKAKRRNTYQSPLSRKYSNYLKKSSCISNP